MANRQLRTISPLAGLLSMRHLSLLSGQRTIFPYYHVVSDETLPHISHLYTYRNEQEFEGDLETMLRHFEPISIEQYLEGKGVQGGKQSMVLSFDDGLVECYSYIAPLLRKKGIPAIFFLNNDFIDNRGLFYRYKASILIDHLEKVRTARTLAAEYMQIPEEQLRDAILMINYRQIPLLDALSLHVEVDDAIYLRDRSVYMSTEQVKKLMEWGFHVGAHSMDHPQFYRMEEKKMEAQVSRSMFDLRERFKISPACFAFPFSSDGIPERIIDEILNEKIADVLFGTAGLKKTGRSRFVQRISMESSGLPAGRLLKAEHLAYLLKGIVGRNNYFKA